MSSMQSAPATIPATSAGTFSYALAPADPGTVTVAATSSGSPQELGQRHHRRQPRARHQIRLRRTSPTAATTHATLALTG